MTQVAQADMLRSPSEGMRHARTMSVDQPGMFSVVQDLGRYGHQRYGVPVNGAMDEWSHRVANALVGNPSSAATLECTLSGPTLRFSHDTLIALCGADMRVTAGDRAVPMQRAVLLRRGVPLIFCERIRGARTYLAVRGGLGTAPVLNSRSTYVRGGFGGFQGRALRKGDQVPLNASDTGCITLERRLMQSGLRFVAAAAVDVAAPASSLDEIRFIPGPQWAAFTPAARRAFVGHPFSISNQSDRMGYRLDGPALPLKAALEMISEAVNFGTVQVPPSGQPIVLMADRQGAGGYPKIAYVASADLPALAQALPGDTLQFKAITQNEAEQLYWDVEDQLALVQAAAAQAIAPNPS
jgi:antagonist of KipI